MFGRLGLGDLSSFGSSGGGASAVDDTAVAVSAIATVATKTNATAIVSFSQVAGVDIQTTPAVEISAIATVGAEGVADYKDAAAISNIAAVTGAGLAGYTATVGISNIAATSIERDAGYSWTNSEGAAWEAQADTTGWDDAFRGDVDQLISDLKSGTVNGSNTYSGFDRILLMDTPNSSDSLRYLNAPTLTATAVNTPAFAATEGFTGDGSTSYINTNFTPSTDGVQYTQNSASLAVWVRGVGASGTKYYLGVNDGGLRTSIRRQGDGSAWDGRGPNAGATTLTATTVSESATGLLGINRSGASARQAYRNGSAENSDTDASTGLAAIDAFLFALNSSGSAIAHSSGQLAIALVGRSFTANEQADIYAALNTYRTAREAA